jgi:hypothetical protein
LLPSSSSLKSSRLPSSSFVKEYSQKGQFEKTFGSKFRFKKMLTFCNDEQDAKQLCPIEVTLFGIVIDDNDKQDAKQ